MSGEADKPGGKEAAAEPDTPKKKSKKFILVAGGVAVLLAVVGGLEGLGMLPSFYHATASRKTVAAAPGAPQFVDLPEMVVNLDAGPRHETYAKVQCRIEADSAADGAKVTAALPKIVDMLQTYLRTMRPDELQNGAGLYRLKEAFLARATIVVPDARLDDILFQELLVQ